MTAAPPDPLLLLARAQRLYPAVILSGGSAEARQEAALRLARALLCAAPPKERPCDRCRHCSRIAWPGEEAPFHPDFRVLLRDRRTVTSTESARALIEEWQRHPFEARGQVFVVAEADTLAPEASDALLKALEEPGTQAPRTFLLLAPAAGELPATLRSRCLRFFLGNPPLPEERISALVEKLCDVLERYFRGEGSVYLLAASQLLVDAADFADPQDARPFLLVARAVLEVALRFEGDPARRRALLELANDLLEAPAWRLRGISPERILSGLVSQRLAGLARPRARRG